MSVCVSVRERERFVTHHWDGRIAGLWGKREDGGSGDRTARGRGDDEASGADVDLDGEEGQITSNSRETQQKINWQQICMQ